MNKLVIGILAHVDAGKTTLSEGLLYLSGRIRKLGRVDKKDAFLDNFELERARGITIFSKQAIFEVDGTQITLLDTPGHVDFSAEMERTLQVLDYAILVVSGADGVQGHTKTLWRLLELYGIPAFIFINKMDQEGTDRSELLHALKRQLSEGCVDFGQTGTTSFCEQLALCDEGMMDAYLKTGQFKTQQIKKAIRDRKLFPCFFGSALKLEGVEAFMRALVKYAEVPVYPRDFRAKVFKISRDEQGNRLTHMKITGGKLRARDVISNGVWEEKVNQIRLYSGAKYQAVSEAEAGAVCAVTGLTRTKPGDGLGGEEASGRPVLEPVLTYQILPPEGCDPKVLLPKLRQLEEEDPELHIVWDEQLEEIRVQVMGEVQLEILKSLIQNRFGQEVTFDAGRILYKETIANTVEGVGHFEPLRHYAEVHLLLEPGEPGSGLKYAVDCSDDVLARNWKNLILSHLKEKEHRGVLTGSPITDMKITLVSGRAHPKHTQGGDFREATWRAVRQGLKEAESVLLEPYYAFQLELPEKMVGRAMSDIEKMHGTCRIARIQDGVAVLEGKAPVSTMRNYQKDVAAYTRGHGRLMCHLAGYGPCHNADEIIRAIGYDSERDADNPTGSVFCANGTGFLVSWDQVKNYMHVESCLKPDRDLMENPDRERSEKDREEWLDPEEVDRILQRTYFANQGKKTVWHKPKTASGSPGKPAPYVGKPREAKEEYLLVDGYNIIFAWPELRELAEDNIDAARTRLLDELCKYRGLRNCRIIAVFDAYRVQGHQEEILDYHNIHVVYTREAQTADHYIEKFAHDNQKRYDITVATSDNLQQVIIRGAGCAVWSADDLRKELQRTNEGVLQAYREKQAMDRNYLRDKLSRETKERMEALLREEERNG
ncbi:translation factor GTPase family protein [Thermoclostridium caenicola]|uniref:Small GTP-binding protein domain-containing protein n=1 Tax=Thermoclostridium caenicola TaxID=659425 RepID=A0A1M6CL45_9FIRM|nr:TetM/TetW/TetO/TetS family tetracycline resistance ribosomal protection protein [Thermoclostridium caenicola]SHI61737.1 small GTP-binding protein domain-containing protein [Thermoclostridium caenicola]HOP73152.1 TetM/TetW/TetO/TetS family tetracycline resistance ribosomal protection protein [Thermoclostridium caenicola]